MYRISLIPFPGMEGAIVRRILDKDGMIRRSRPEITEDGYSNCAAYVWRMVVFTISKVPRHQCMPVMSQYYLPEMASADEQRQLIKWMDALADKVCAQVPVTEWHGIARWSEVL